jgi:DNA-binding response OmpR family regulator
MNVLFVSENADLRAAAERVLAREGYHVMTAAHSGHALLAGLECERIDILVSEWELDSGSGETLAASLRRYHRDMRAMFMANPGAAARSGVVVRPFTLDDLLREMGASSPLTSPAAF